MKPVSSNAYKYKIIYEILMTVLAVVAVTITVLDIIEYINMSIQVHFYYIDTAILIIFSIDYIVRLILSKDKKAFFKSNILDLVAIIPFNSFFRVFRIARMIRLLKVIKALKLFKLTAFTRHIVGRVSIFLKTNGFIYILVLSILIVGLGAVGIYSIEYRDTNKTFTDALWWSFVTVTTVGYGDISPETSMGRILAGILMIFGIGFIGMLTGTIATFFLKKDNVKPIKNQRDIDLSGLDENDIRQVHLFIEFLKNKNNKEEAG